MDGFGMRAHYSRINLARKTVIEFTKFDTMDVYLLINVSSRNVLEPKLSRK